MYLKNTSSSSLPIKFLQEEKGKSQRHKEGRGSNAQKKKERRRETKSERNGKKKPESEQRCRQNVRLKDGSSRRG